MALIDLINEPQINENILPAVYTGTTQGAATDLSNCEISTGAIVMVGAYSAGNTTTNVQCEESTSTSGPWTAIAGMVCTVTASTQLFVLRGQRQHKYARMNAVTVTGTTPSLALSSVLIAQQKYVATAGNQGGYSRSPSS